MGVDPEDRLDVLQCATLSGDACDVVRYRHNRRPALRAVAVDVDGLAARLRRRRALLHEILTMNLTSVEQRTWIRLLQTPSVSAVAKEEGVTRTAIYARIRGSRRSPGMIHKNPFVAQWWARRGSND
jgi:hypothetical protein